jgi:hypothetical protein
MSRAVRRTGATESYRVRLERSTLGLLGNATAPPIPHIPAGPVPAKAGTHKREPTTLCKRTHVEFDPQWKGDDVFAEAPVGDGATVRAVFVDYEAR